MPSSSTNTNPIRTIIIIAYEYEYDDYLDELEYELLCGFIGVCSYSHIFSFINQRKTVDEFKTYIEQQLGVPYWTTIEYTKVVTHAFKRVVTVIDIAGLSALVGTTHMVTGYINKGIILERI